MHMVTRHAPCCAISSLMLINEDLRLLKRIVLCEPLFHLPSRLRAKLDMHKHHPSDNDNCMMAARERELPCQSRLGHSCCEVYQNNVGQRFCLIVPRIITSREKNHVAHVNPCPQGLASLHGYTLLSLPLSSVSHQKLISLGDYHACCSCSVL